MNAKNWKIKSLQQRIRGWFPQQPKLGRTIQHTAQQIRTNPKPLNKEDIKEIAKSVTKSIILINFGVFFVFSALYGFALNDSYFVLNPVGNTVGLAAFFGLCSTSIVFGILEFKKYRDAIDFKGRLKFLEIIPNIIGFALMSVGVYAASLYVSRPLPKSVPDFYSWHPYATLGFDIYLAGIVVLVATLLLYNYLVPKQITARLVGTKQGKANGLTLG